ncbi:MAG: hypothetical protein RI924_1298 [Bacteroidota bacterium]|jgi:hypothetical protein
MTRIPKTGQILIMVTARFDKHQDLSEIEDQGKQEGHKGRP